MTRYEDVDSRRDFGGAKPGVKPGSRPAETVYHDLAGETIQQDLMVAVRAAMSNLNPAGSPSPESLLSFTYSINLSAEVSSALSDLSAEISDAQQSRAKMERIRANGPRGWVTAAALVLTAWKFGLPFLPVQPDNMTLALVLSASAVALFIREDLHLVRQISSLETTIAAGEARRDAIIEAYEDTVVEDLEGDPYIMESLGERDFDVQLEDIDPETGTAILSLEVYM